MGAWHFENFDNDAAMDWIYDFSMNPTETFLADTFKLVNTNTDYIESDDGASALAAAEVVAAIKGNKTNAWPEDIDVPDSLRISNGLTADALQAIDKVSSNISELKELWQESDDYENWLAVLEGLKQRLQQ
jgi:hypothetical protein